jgi:hypothetical protein
VRQRETKQGKGIAKQRMRRKRKKNNKESITIFLLSVTYKVNVMTLSETHLKHLAL